MTTSEQAAAWEARGIRVVTRADSGYPPNLRGLPGAPRSLFLAGRLEPADTRSIAVVGARAASPRGLDAAGRIATRLAGDGYTVISGLAAGIDTAAHRGALHAGGRTVAVIGTGHGRCYPPQNAALQAEIAENGAVVSQFRPDSPPRRENFPMRNAVLSGMALGTVIVEAGETGGTRIQARLAVAQGRPVFLLAPLLERSWARELATRPGVEVVGTVNELIAAVASLTRESTALRPTP